MSPQQNVTVYATRLDPWAEFVPMATCNPDSMTQCHYSRLQDDVWMLEDSHPQIKIKTSKGRRVSIRGGIEAFWTWA